MHRRTAVVEPEEQSTLEVHDNRSANGEHSGSHDHGGEMDWNLEDQDEDLDDDALDDDALDDNDLDDDGSDGGLGVSEKEGEVVVQFANPRHPQHRCVRVSKHIICAYSMASRLL
jgi:hypothetical protein